MAPSIGLKLDMDQYPFFGKAGGTHAPPTNVELREDGSRELREDGTIELRE